MIFWYFIKFKKISLFIEIYEEIFNLYNGTCNTAFESLGVIVLNMIIFGYHSGTQNTRNSENVRHLKWGRLERSHLEFCGISQQVLTISIIIKKSALSSSIRKYLTPRSYLASLTIYLQIHLY